MKIGNKITKLRKMKGMSQEELGFEVNVTRQTVSKWELGTTTPDYTSLKELSRVFGVSIELLTDEEQELEDNNEYKLNDYTKNLNNNSNSNNKKSNTKIFIVIGIIVILVIVGIIFIVNNKKEKVEKEKTGIFALISSMQEKFEEIYSKAMSNIDENEKEMEEKTNDFDVEFFNMEFGNAGLNSGMFAEDIIEKIEDSNKKNEKQIALIFMNKEIKTPDEYKDAVLSIETSDKYYISFEYDDEGYINIANIEKTESSNNNNNIDKAKFNIFLGKPGETVGLFIKDIISQVEKSNQTNDKKITLIFNGNEIVTADEFKNTVSSIENMTKYYATYTYDEDGYVQTIELENM